MKGVFEACGLFNVAPCQNHTNKEVLIWVARRCFITNESITCQYIPQHHEICIDVFKVLPYSDKTPFINFILKKHPLSHCFFDKYSLKFNMNKINQKLDSNSKLLTILCKRDSNTLLKTCKEDAWPGKRRPSFAITRRTIQRSQSSNRITKTRNKNSEENLLRTTRKRLIHTSEVVSSSRSLSLVPKSTAINLGVLKNKGIRNELMKPIISI